MIVLPTQQELQELKAAHDPCCVTIYAPFIEPNGANNPNRIQLKNLLKRARAGLAERGVSPLDVRRALRAAYSLVNSGELWPIQRADFALFLHTRGMRHYHAPPGSVAESVVVADQFDVSPLEHVVAANASYFVLTLSHNGVQLYRGDEATLSPVHVAGLSGTMEQILRIDEYPNARELHGIAPANIGKGSEGYHQQYNVTETDKKMLAMFFQYINERLQPYLAKQRYPLIIAGVNYLLPIYRKANTYPSLLAHSIRGNVAQLTRDVLRAKAWQIIQAHASQPPAHYLAAM